jgi:hypothetical protein
MVTMYADTAERSALDIQNRHFGPLPLVPNDRRPLVRSGFLVCLFVHFHRSPPGDAAILRATCGPFPWNSPSRIGSNFGECTLRCTSVNAVR